MTLQAYELSDGILKIKKSDRSKIEELLNFEIFSEPLISFPQKVDTKHELRNNLRELVFVRLVTALEIFFIDLIRDAFLINKEPFKRQDVSPAFTQAELLSIHSTAEIYNKIINKECRKLTSGGFLDIVKFYRKYFNIEMGNFAPGLDKMQEYHDRRHLQVHRLGITDQSYRDKYKYSKHYTTIDDPYLIQCFQDFKNFSEMVYNQIKYQLENEFIIKKKKEKIIEREAKLIIIFPDQERPACLDPKFEFWCDDEFLMLQDILDNKKDHENECELSISGKIRQVKVYSKLVKAYVRKSNAVFKKVEEPEVKVKVKKAPTPPNILDEILLELIQNKLPKQPWPTGIHKVIASEINVSNHLVSLAIQQLISKGIFMHQINGVIIDNVKSK
jgi:hypothetical protein